MPDREKTHALAISGTISIKRPDLIIIGAGIAGISVALAAEEARLSYIMVADKKSPPGSVAALGMIYMGSFSGRQLERARRSVILHQQRGHLLFDDVRTTDWRPGKRGDVRSVRHKAVDVSAILSAVRPSVRLTGRVIGVYGRTVSLESGQGLYAGRGVIVCTGADTLLDVPTPEKISYGATLQYASAGKWAALHRIRPYHDVSLVDNGKVMLVGSSSTDNPGDAIGAVKAMASMTPFVLTGQPDILTGRRAFWGNPQKSLEPLYQGDVCYFGGLGKAGFALAPAIGQEIVQHYREQS